MAHRLVSSRQKLRVGAKISQVQRQSCTPRWHCERWFWFVRSISWTRIISITSDSRKSHGHYIKTAWLRRTSSRPSIRSHLSRKFQWNLDGIEFRIGNVFCSPQTRIILYVDDSKKTLESSRIWNPCGRNWWSRIFWDALIGDANRLKQSLNITQRCFSPVYRGGKNLTHKH